MMRNAAGWRRVQRGLSGLSGVVLATALLLALPSVATAAPDRDSSTASQDERTGGDAGSDDLEAEVAALPPANDDFANAQALAGASGTTTGSTVGSTVEVDEPDHDGLTAEHSIWYSWTPPVDARVQVDTFGSGFDTVLAVYTGSTLPTLVEVAANDQAPHSDQSMVRFDAVGGTTYSIAVDGWDGQTGAVELYHGPQVSTFTDVGPTHPFFDEIEWMDEQDLSNGYDDGTYRPADPVTRQAMSAFLFRLAGEPDLPPPPQPFFSDVPFSHVFAEEIYWMDDAGIATGYADLTFRPGAVVTRQAMSAFMHRYHTTDPFDPPSTPTFTDVSSANTFYEDIEWMADEGISTGYDDGTYRPAAPVTRQAMSAFLFRLWELCTCPT
jgi:hypothetical protein